jgi:hypothetical protein
MPVARGGRMPSQAHDDNDNEWQIIHAERRERYSIIPGKGT